MLLNNKEIFIFINSVIKKLEQAGEDKWAEKLKDAMLISFMPGELFREIRQALRMFQETKLPQKIKVIDELNIAIKSLDEIIGDK